MKFLCIVKPTGMPVPPEMLMKVLEGFAAWRAQWKPMMESFYFFANNQGGCGIINIPDETTLHAFSATFPFAIFSTIEILPIVDGDQALASFTKIAGEMLAALQ